MAGWHSKTLAGSVQRIEQRLENVMSEISDANDKLTQMETQMQANRDLLVELHTLATNALPGGRILAQDVVDLTSRMDADLTSLTADDTSSAASTPARVETPATPAA